MMLGKHIFKKAALGVFLFQMGSSLCSGMDEPDKGERESDFWNAGLNTVSSWFHGQFAQFGHLIGIQQEERGKSQSLFLGLPADIWSLILKPKYSNLDFYERIYNCAQYGSLIRVCKASNQLVKYQLDTLFNDYIQRGLPPVAFHFDRYMPTTPYIKRGMRFCLSELNNRNMSDKITFDGIKGPDFKAFVPFLNTIKTLEIKSPGPLIIRPLVGLLKKSPSIETVNLTIGIDWISWTSDMLWEKLPDDLHYLSEDHRLKEMLAGGKMVKGILKGKQINTIAQIQPSWSNRAKDNTDSLPGPLDNFDNTDSLPSVFIDEFPQSLSPSRTGIIKRADRDDEAQLRSIFHDLGNIERLYNKVHQDVVQTMKEKGEMPEYSFNSQLDSDPVKQNAVKEKIKSAIVTNFVEACQSNNPENDADVMREFILSVLCEAPFSVGQLQTLLDFIQAGAIRNTDDLEEVLNRFRTEK